MVVESDGVHVKELPYIVHKVSREKEDKINHNNQGKPLSLSYQRDKFKIDHRRKIETNSNKI